MNSFLKDHDLIQYFTVSTTYNILIKRLFYSGSLILILIILGYCFGYRAGPCLLNVESVKNPVFFSREKIKKKQEKLKISPS